MKYVAYGSRTKETYVPCNILFTALIWTTINENMEYEVKQYFSYVFQFFMVSLVGR